LSKGGAHHKVAAEKMALTVPVRLGSSENPGIVPSDLDHKLMLWMTRRKNLWRR
jgi:hypothetical protein